MFNMDSSVELLPYACVVYERAAPGSAWQFADGLPLDPLVIHCARKM